MADGGWEPWVLRSWREAARLTVHEVATELGVSARAVYGWEASDRADFDRARSLDKLYRSNGLLPAMLLADGPTRGLPEEVVWWHNFDGDGAVWAWIQARIPGEIELSPQWGPLQAVLTVDVTDRGLLVVSPLSGPAPVRISLSRPGWIAWGAGKVPTHAPVPVFNIIDAADQQLISLSDGHPTVAWVLSRLARHSETWVNKFITGFPVRRYLAVQAVRSRTRSEVHDLEECKKEDRSVLRFSPSEYRTLRDSRQLTVEQVTKAVNERLRDPLMQQSATDRSGQVGPLSADQMHRFEHRGTRPRSLTHFDALLDVIYRADGRTCCEPVTVEDTDDGHSISFPSWWHGPVWVRVHGPATSDPCVATLYWKPWKKSVGLLPSGAAVTTRTGRGIGPLVVTLPDGWTAEAGIGVCEGAFDINPGWEPTKDEDTGTLMQAWSAPFFKLLGTTSSAMITRITDSREGPRRSKT